MTEPTIIIKRLNLMGYTAETQMWFVMNGGGGQKTFNFLGNWAKKGAFENVQHMGMLYLGLVGQRAAKFAKFAADQGFAIKWEAAA